MTFVNSPNKVFWRWEHEASLHDLDGSLTGIIDAKVVPDSTFLPPSNCEVRGEFSIGKQGKLKQYFLVFESLYMLMLN